MSIIPHTSIFYLKRFCFDLLFLDEIMHFYTVKNTEFLKASNHV